MTGLRDHVQGLWLPLVTPFQDGALDERSLRRLTRHYGAGAVDGFILGATSGEGMTLREAELERLVAVVRDEMAASGRTVPICLGLSGADTSRLMERLDETADWPIDGYLIASPYYVRPSQRGLLAHFEALADHAAWPIALYNIPYRCAVNISNQTLLRLAEHRNIVGLKDCGASREQSIALLRDRPKDFRVLTGEDANYFEALTDGADGGIVLSAHVETATFVRRSISRSIAAASSLLTSTIGRRTSGLSIRPVRHNQYFAGAGLGSANNSRDSAATSFQRASAAS